MSDQQIADWISEHRDALNVDIPEGADIEVKDHGLMISKKFGRVQCDGPCTALSPEDKVIIGNFDDKTNTIELYKNAFTAQSEFGPVTRAPDGSYSTTHYRNGISKVEHAVFTVGHEAAHARGIDLYKGVEVLHPEANYHGVEALRNFRSLYGN